MPEVRVQPRSVYEHHVYIQKANVTLNWSFSTKKKSICFGLFFRPGNDIKYHSSTTDSTRASIDGNRPLNTSNSTNNNEKRRNLSLPKLSHLRSNTTKAAEEHLPSTPPTPTTPNISSYFSDNEENEQSSTNGHRNKRYSMVSSTVKDAITIHSSRNRRKSSSAISVINLLDNDFVELIPIDQVNSSKESITGSYLAEEPGNYVLIFDNTFSRNTSKTLKFTVTSDEIIDEGSESDNDMCGWLLKKRRKRMQGWAKRWFELSTTGILSYSVRKGDIKRGSLQIMLATISISPKQRTIHIDSGTTIFHLKALSAESYEEWLNCVRAKRSVTNPSVDAFWNNDAHSVTSLLPDLVTTTEANRYEQNHQIIVDSLNNLDTEIKLLKKLITKNVTPIVQQQHIAPESDPSSPLNATNDTDLIQQSAPPPVQSQSSSMKLIRFPFIRAASSNHVVNEEKRASLHQSTIDSIMASIQQLSDYRDKLSTSYYENYEAGGNNIRPINPLDVPNRTGTGFLSNRSPSFYSFAQSDQFFDAEDFLLSNEDNESTYGSIDFDSEDEEEKDSAEKDLIQLSHTEVKRRIRLPHPVAVQHISFLGILRKNIGKDLSTISMPIILNEPINFLQRLCEELEYSELLDKAAAQTNSMDRLMYVTAFAISGYAASQYRIGRKPFNPLMNETYECIRPDKGFRFVSEKVSHRPNVMACYAESRNFEYRQSNYGKTKFWGKSLELITEGQTYIQLKGSNDEYTYSKPSSWLRNLVAGTKYLEHIGEMRVDNHSTREYAIVTFKEGTSGGTLFFSSNNNESSRNNIVAKFFDNQGSLVREVEGKWSDAISEVIGPDQYAVIWRCKAPGIPDYTDYYGLSSFAMELNEITSLEKDKIPITDTRYRPDQRLFENGQVVEAEAEKLRLEQDQRDRRKANDTPLWFEMKPDPYSPTGESWQYKGGYWEARNSQQWPSDVPKLW